MNIYKNNYFLFFYVLLILCVYNIKIEAELSAGLARNNQYQVNKT